MTDKEIKHRRRMLLFFKAVYVLMLANQVFLVVAYIVLKQWLAAVVMLFPAALPILGLELIRRLEHE